MAEAAELRTPGSGLNERAFQAELLAEAEAGHFARVETRIIETLGRQYHGTLFTDEPIVSRGRNTLMMSNDFVSDNIGRVKPGYVIVSARGRGDRPIVRGAQPKQFQKPPGEGTWARACGNQMKAGDKIELYYVEAQNYALEDTYLLRMTVI
eukprot:CAMPEP_0119270618 /NCGR_PEP_ID=MMETSP1329-20130426/7551_1 /TAXON_ID=114041 /ORGANISM="Genus nov. species nov., Strain RCC1024" /LENGTH=151 /DNA_ID=CAMNT_0007270643 /DNA_START=149 /DNA_END=601 /DNA_ORIENTATION=+